MRIIQEEIALAPKKRGFHLITNEIENRFDGLKQINKGIAQIFIKHTSAGLTLNENADSSVRRDFESFFNILIPENLEIYEHNYEGSDDMPAHLKTSIIGASVLIPISNGKFNLGAWQGIYLCEFRNDGGARKVVISAIGE